MTKNLRTQTPRLQAAATLCALEHALTGVAAVHDRAAEVEAALQTLRRVLEDPRLDERPAPHETGAAWAEQALDDLLERPAFD